MRRPCRWFFHLFVILALLSIAGPAAAPAAPAAPWQSKVDAWVQQTAAQGETEFLVLLSEQADLSSAAKLPSKVEKGAYVYQQLTRTAARTQGPLLAELRARHVPHRAYWVANMLWVRGDASLVQALAQRQDVAHIYANPWVQQALPQPPTSQVEALEAIEWNILKVRAEQVWAAGYTGQGAVIAGQDTGYDWDHTALVQQYRGWDGAAADHNYNWHDAIHEDSSFTTPGNPCGFDSPVPCDDHGHGTHTMGTMVGDDGGSNQIGMAPGARWIGCRNMEQGWGSPASYSECFQWFIAPTDLNGQNPRPDLAPDVINNSWGCPAAEGCSDVNILKTVVENVRAAGILTVSSAGNSGPTCSTIAQPIAIYDASFTVGATDSGDLIASFSSRGPVTADSSNRLKPDISAPGVSVRSSYLNNTYTTMNGTSMAAPHVAGLAGLLISAAPHLAGQVDLLESIITGSAVPRTTTQNCGTVPGSAVPNNTYGYGRIDALEALQDIPPFFNLTASANPPQIIPGQTITYTLELRYTSFYTPTHNIIISNVLPIGTSFITATLPYTFTGDSVAWAFPAMNSGDIRQVQLVLALSPQAVGSLLNDQYSAYSQEVPLTPGIPLSTPIVTYEVSQGIDLLAWPGETLTYTLPFTNTSLVSATFSLMLNSVQGWSNLDTGGITTTLTLGAGQSSGTLIHTQIPEVGVSGLVEEPTLSIWITGNNAHVKTISSSIRVGYLLYLPAVERQ